MSLHPVTHQPMRSWRGTVPLSALIAVVTAATVSFWFSVTPRTSCDHGCPHESNVAARPALTVVPQPALPTQSVHLSAPAPGTQLADVCWPALDVDSSQLSREGRVVPVFKDGKATGLKVYAIREGSFYTAIGLSNGDTILQINGLEMLTPAASVFLNTGTRTGPLTGSQFVDMSVVRKGKTIRLIALLHENC